MAGPKGLVAENLSEALLKVSNCAEVESRLASARDDLGLHVSESNGVIRALESYQARNTFTLLGSEYSPSEDAIDLPRATEAYAQIEMIARSCPNTAAILDNLSKVYPGPLRYFARKSPEHVRVIGIESDSLKTASAEMLTPELENFDPESAPISPAAKAIFHEISKKMASALKVSEGDVQRAVDAETSEEGKDLIRRVGSALIQILDLARQRNHFIVKNAVNQQENMAIVIGSAHIQDLGRLFVQACQLQ